ncbi:MAG: protein kinase [Gammaproteobacteria bacterium]|nr:protein kinase [Gammaproteobacteria bacterium]NNC55944.1 protein kinase [Woeseiaceae bacterium]NNL49957.1 protein kinase [Woeseiaceae bacterium]
MTTAKLENSAPTSHSDRHLIAGRYRTHTRIGHGRLGEIFTATDEGYEELGVEQRLAIQVIPESVVRNNRLFNKINLGYTILRAAAHPSIVNFLQFGRDGKFGFVVMELLDGLSLRLVLDDAEMLTLDETKPVIRGVGEALQLLHAKDMVHGGLTTKAVFITEELEVRLLDVLPLDSAEPIIRGATTSDPFSRCTVEDDVFDLACLAYEMLTGKHPFNYSSPAEARLAGLEAERIVSLTDYEWSALRRALSFEREQRTSSIADFMREFDIRGTERLRPTVDQPPRHEPIAYPAVAEAAPLTRPGVPAQSAATVDSVPRYENRPPKARPSPKRARPLRTTFLGMLLAGLSAWSIYGEPQESIVNLISYVDESMNVGLTGRHDEVVKISTPDPARSVSTDRLALVDHPAATAPAATDEVMPADLEAKRSEPEHTATTEGVVAVLAQPTDRPAPAAPPKGGNTTDTGDEATNRTADEVSADTNAAPMQTESELGFVESIVSVSERDGAARIAALRTQNSATPLIWWTSEHTANADQDFISVEQQTLADVSIEDSNMLYVSLVNDNLPEPPESFFISLGFRNTQQGQIERIATVRVDIIDDDLP